MTKLVLLAGAAVFAVSAPALAKPDHHKGSHSWSYNGSHCPPGLAKKRNGCMPPGQAKKWRTGYPLPRDVVYYPVPADIAIRLGTPPAGHKFVRVATDILLIAVGTGLVIDAIDDLGRL